MYISVYIYIYMYIYIYIYIYMHICKYNGSVPPHRDVFYQVAPPEVRQHLLRYLCRGNGFGVWGIAFLVSG